MDNGEKLLRNLALDEKGAVEAAWRNRSCIETFLDTPEFMPFMHSLEEHECGRVTGVLLPMLTGSRAPEKADTYSPMHFRV